MTDRPGKRKDPTRLVALLIVGVVLAVLAIALYTALSGKREYDAERAQADAARSAVPLGNRGLPASGVSNAGH